jgi:hypothetical protein
VTHTSLGVTNLGVYLYFPKGSDFRNVTEEALTPVVKKLNHRPPSATDPLMRSFKKLGVVQLESESACL